MSAVNCPFDNDFCQKKEIRFDAWQKVIIKSEGVSFPMAPDMFSDCPIADDNEREQMCERYKRLLFIAGKTTNEQR